MRKFNLLVISLLAAGYAMAMSSCSSSQKDNGADSTAAEETLSDNVVATPADSLAAIFVNPDKKSDLPTDSTYAVTSTGLKYMILREGDGKSPSATDVVTVHYEGKLTDGTVFDSSYSRGEPASFPLNRVIPGWTEGLQLMKTNGKAVFYIPSALGYGPAGAPPVIPPNADLIFTVELISID